EASGGSCRAKMALARPPRQRRRGRGDQAAGRWLAVRSAPPDAVRTATASASPQRPRELMVNNHLSPIVAHLARQSGRSRQASPFARADPRLPVAEGNHLVGAVMADIGGPEIRNAGPLAPVAGDLL